MPSYGGVVSQRQGGNMLGLDSVHDNAVMWTAFVAVDGDQASLALAEAEMNVMTARVREASAKLHGDMGFVFLNYAGASQDPLGSYGSANVQHMRDVAAAYDPAGVFQKRVPGGFKISRVS